MKFIKKHSWKVLSVIILLYTFYKGLSTPLNPGITSVNTLNLTTGENENVSINAYNLNYAGDIKYILIQHDTTPVAMANNIASTDNLVTFDCNIPIELKSKSLGIVMGFENHIAGLESAFFVKDATINKDAYYTPIDIPDVETNVNYLPNLTNLQESIRNLFFHVPMWFSMMTLMLISFITSIIYLKNKKVYLDIIAYESARLAIVFGLIGLATGMLWAKHTWGQYFPLNEPQLQGATASIIMYLAYMILRKAIKEEERQRLIAGVYNIFAFPLMYVFIRIYPKYQESLHPGNGENESFQSIDLDGSLAIIFRPAALGWILLAIWILTLTVRYRKLQEYEG